MNINQASVSCKLPAAVSRLTGGGGWDRERTQAQIDNNNALLLLDISHVGSASCLELY